MEVEEGDIIRFKDNRQPSTYSNIIAQQEWRANIPDKLSTYLFSPFAIITICKVIPLCVLKTVITGIKALQLLYKDIIRDNNKFEENICGGKPNSYSSSG